jgi:virulence factor Mce-like protein
VGGILTRLLAWVRRRRVALVAFLCVAIVGAGIGYAVQRSGPTHTYSAEMASAPGLYPGNFVDILGIPVGRVVSVTPNPAGARVAFTVKAGVRVPNGVQVLLMAPELISDRYIELAPAYTSGPVLADHATIPVGRTATPVSVDEIFDSIDELANALGPRGANAHGALTQLLHRAATALGPNGTPLNQTLVSLGQALGALSAHPGDLTSLLNGVGNLTQAASQNLTAYQSFSSELAQVSGDLASDNGDIATALSDLQGALGQLVTFVTDDGTALGSSIDNLRTFAATVASEESGVAQTFGVLPVALQNLVAAFNPDAPGGPGMTARFDPMSGSAAFDRSICGNSMLRLLTVALATPANPDLKSGDDLVCGLAGVVASLPTPPGASSGPDLTVSALLRGQP